MSYTPQSVAAYVELLHTDHTRTAEANAALLAFQRSPECWAVAEALLASEHDVLVQFAASALHQRARSGDASGLDAIEAACGRLLGAIGAVRGGAAARQLCLAVAHLAWRLCESSPQPGASPVAVCRAAQYAALPPAAQVELLTALPEARPRHREALKGAAAEVLGVLQRLSPPGAPAALHVAQCVRAWQPLGIDLADLAGGGGVLLGALALALQAEEPLCGVAADALCDALQTGSYPPPDATSPLLRQMLAALVAAAPHVVGPAGADGAALALARVASATVVAAPAAAVALAADGAPPDGPAELLLLLSSQRDLHLLEELEPAWAALAQPDADGAVLPARVVAAWRGLLPLLLRHSEFPADDDGGGGGSGGEANGAPPSREVQWEAVDAEIDEGEFFRFRRLCATEVWQSAALALGPVAVLAELSAALRGAAAASWRPVEACLYALAAIAPALLPRGGRGGRGEPPPPPSPTAAASELDTVLGPLLAASAALPADAHSQLLRASLKLGGAFAAWLGKGAGTAQLESTTQFALRSLHDPLPSVAQEASTALWSLCSDGGCAAALLPHVPSLLPHALAALRAPALGRAAEALVHALVRLLVRLPSADLAAPLATLSAAIAEQLASARDAAAASAASPPRTPPRKQPNRPGGAAPAADVESVAAGAARRLRAAIKFLDAAPPLPDGSHAVVCVLGECWGPLEALRQTAAALPAAEAEEVRLEMCATYESAVRAAGRGEGSHPLAPLLSQLAAALGDILRAGWPAAPPSPAAAPTAERTFGTPRTRTTTGSAGGPDGGSAGAALRAYATLFEQFGRLPEAAGRLGTLLEELSAAIGQPLCDGTRLAATPELGAHWLELLHRAAIFCAAALLDRPAVLATALHLAAAALRLPNRETIRSACVLLSRIASTADEAQLPPATLATLAPALIAALVAAVAAHAPPELLPRVADALRALLERCGAAAAGWLRDALGREALEAPHLGHEQREAFVVGAAALVAEPRAFPAAVFDLQLLCRAAAPPPREAYKSQVFVQ